MSPDVLPEDDHDAELIANVHPPDWTNPTAASRYNLVVVGAGTAGLVAAGGAAMLGARVALVERHLLGGDCLSTGCVPSKAVIRSARLLADAHNAADFGIQVPRAEVDFGAVMARMRRLRARISHHDSVGRFRDMGVDVFLGHARFTGADALEAGGARLRFARAVIATGARPAAPGIDGLMETGYLTSETVFSLTQRPPRLAVLGAGPLGCELAQAFQRLGSAVVLIARGDGVMPREDSDAGALVRTALARDGVRVLVNAQVSHVSRTSTGKTLQVDLGGARERVVVDEILVGAGRTPNVEDLGLDAAGVRLGADGGVAVDDRLRTTNRRIYAAGDVCLARKFTHAANHTARVALLNALLGARKTLSAITIPWCTYTDPEVAQVGLTAAEAARHGVPIDTLASSLGDNDRAVVDGEEAGFVKVHLKKGTARIVGATVVARHAGEMINEITLAMTQNAGVRGLGRVVRPYPTQAEAISDIADAYTLSRLTPLVKRLLGAWFAWSR